MESKYQVTYNKSKYGWFANISYFDKPRDITKTNRYRTIKTDGCNSLSDLCEIVTKKILDLEKENG